MSQTRQLAAIMFTDIVGYTALMDEDEQKAFDLLKKNRQVQRPIIEKHNGKWLKEMGDGVLASFATVTDAVYCAKEIQKTCQNESELNLRIGIHQGEVVFDGEDVFGSGVNIASRLEPLAPIGGILVSESVHRNLGNKKDIVSTFLGEEQLKNVKEPIRVYLVQVEGIESVDVAEPSIRKQQTSPTVRNPKKIVLLSLAIIVALVLAYFFYPRQSSGDSQLAQPEIIDKSIAVLPFKNDSPDADNQYFADGMMDEILNHLQKISELGVKSRTAVEPYRNSTQGFTAIAQELEVAFILEGAVRKYGDRFRVTTQLIEVESGNHLWSDTYDGIFSDTIFVVQSNIAKQIASALDVIITPEEKKVIEKFPTTNVTAYELFIKGAHEMSAYWGPRDKKHILAARKFFDRALEIDPDYYEAINGKGNTFMAEENYDSAFIYVEKLIALDPMSSNPYQLKGECYFFMGKTDLAIESYSKAINMAAFKSIRNHFYTYIQLGRTLDWEKGETLQALSYYSEALQLGFDDKEGAYIFIALALASIGDYDRVLEYLRIRRESSDNCFLNYIHARVLLIQGKIQQALTFTDSTCNQAQCEVQCIETLFEASLLLADFEKAEQYFYQWQNHHEPERRFRYHFMNCGAGYVYYKLGRLEEADKAFTEEIKKLELEVDRNYKSHLHLSRIFASQGNRVEALKHLSEYAKIGFADGWHDFILIDPFFESLRDDPEFQSIVKQEQEEKAALRAQVREMKVQGELTL